MAFYLTGPASEAFCGPGAINRAPHFAGGRMAADVSGLPTTYSLAFWFWNGLPHDARPVTGSLFQRGGGQGKGAPGDTLGIGGTLGDPGRLIFSSGNDNATTLAGKTALGLKTWNHVVLTRAGKDVKVYLNGSPEIAGEAPVGTSADPETMFVGGRVQGDAGFEGKIDEVAIFDRALSPAEAAEQFKTSLPAE